jgi:hypothetical protein
MSTPNRVETRLNAMQYGSTGQLVVAPDEDLALYALHNQSFHDEYQPQGATEENLVQALADVSWRLNRVALLESNLLSISYTPRDLVDCLFSQAKALASLSMHSQRLSRQFERTVALLRELQKARQTQEKKDLAYNPSADGFVFSPAQTDTAPRTRNRSGAGSRPALRPAPTPSTPQSLHNL